MTVIVPDLSVVAPPAHHFHTTDVRIHYRILGDGPPLLLLHGLGSCGEDWFPITPALAPDYRLIVPDLRGHGHSSLPVSRDYAIARMAADMFDLLDHLHIAQTHVLGLSLGGCVALQMACTRPERIDHLLLVNTFARLKSAGSGMWRQRLRRLRAAFGDMDALATIVATSLFADPAAQAFAYERLRRNDMGSMRRSMISIIRFDARPRLADVNCPALILIGDRDATVPASCAADLSAGIAQAQLQIIADAGHALPYDQPEAFVRAVRDFLPT